MSKSILIIETPETCGVCKCCVREQTIVIGMQDKQYEKAFCGITKERVNINRNTIRCPLKPLGRKEEEYELEIWNTRDGTFLCEKGLFDKLYGEDDEID